MGFGVLIFLTLIAFALTMTTLKSSRNINDEITNLYSPSVDALEELNLLVTRSKMLVSSWIHIQKESEDKLKLKKLVYDEYPQLHVRLNQLASEWDKEDRENLSAVFSLISLLSSISRMCCFIRANISYREKVSLTVVPFSSSLSRLIFPSINSTYLATM